MRNENQKPGPNSPFGISVTVDEAVLLKDLVEKLAHRRYDIGFGQQPMPEGWQAVETSTIEAYVIVSMEVYGEGEPLNISYTTCFTFTCTKSLGTDNTLSWINSLS